MGAMKAKMLAWMAVIVLSMALGGAIVVGIDNFGSNDSGSKSAVITQSVPSTSSGASAATANGDLSGLYAQVRPSIVTVEGSNARTGAGGIGSGIILDKQGHILTNNHVVNGFSTLDVVFADGNSLAAKVVGTDPGNDLAL
ncbi:MAG TPA: trypsin-like peptidase domain-containing protein, partial [Dehalococcoidia bacterium]